MLNIDDLKYLCANLGNLSGVPVRLYDSDNEIFYYSTAELLKDPFSIDKNRAFELKEDIAYYQNDYDYYYVLLNYCNIRMVVGPTREIGISEQRLKSFAFANSVPTSLTEEFISGLKSIVSFPLMSLLQVMCVFYFAISGEKKTIEEVTIHQEKQTDIQEDIEKENIIKSDNERDNDSMPYNAFDVENRMLDMVMRGDTAALSNLFKNMPSIRSGLLAQRQIRQSKDIFIVTATLVSRSAIKGGLDVSTALSLSDSYIQKCELSNEFDYINELSYHMVMDYAERVNSLRIKANSSIFVIKVSNYVQQHLSEAIKVQDIADSLYMGRSRLSTNFKKETGMEISTYIATQKIDEAKRLLRYSNKSFTDISNYLGFSSHSHFTKTFKKYTNATPFEYRQMHKRY